MIFANERSGRPNDYEGEAAPPSGGCPFCPGNERETPAPIRLLPRNGSAAEAALDSDWSMRVVPNRFAAMRIEGHLDRRIQGLYDTMNGVGAHEVIIETPVHNARLTDYSERKLQELLAVFRERKADLHRDMRFRYIQVFRNYGHAAGASLIHPHTQLIALPITPRWLEDELHNARQFQATTGRCLFCDLLRSEEADFERLVDQNDDFVAFCPYAAKMMFETWIIPRRHRRGFQFADDQELESLSRILRRALWALSQVLNDPPFNLIIHSAPENWTGSGDLEAVDRCYHWHIEILPRISLFAGFELGTGFHINTVMPEPAAAMLREAAIHPMQSQRVEI